MGRFGDERFGDQSSTLFMRPNNMAELAVAELVIRFRSLDKPETKWKTFLDVIKVNIQDFLQVFQGSEIGKMEDNLTSADPLIQLMDPEETCRF